jgi:hypothetical protein
MEVADLPDRVDEYFVGRVEGDDGICVDRQINKKLIDNLGLRLTFSEHANFGEANFCGVVCDPDKLTIITDPIKVLRNFFVLPNSLKTANDTTHNSMLRAKALSYKYNYNDAPIIGPLCHKVCELTRGIDCRNVQSEIGSYKQNWVNEAILQKLWMAEPKITIESRLHMEKRYGISVSQQMLLEKEISLATIRGFDLTISPMLNDMDIDHSLDFVRDIWDDQFQHKGYPPLVQKVVDNGLTASLPTKSKHWEGLVHSDIAVEPILQ